MIDLSVIILTFNEELHIRRCLENVRQLSEKIYVVDSFSTDKTKEIATELGAAVIEHQWPGNQAEQFNWALDNLPISTKWVMRLDADEYITPELLEEISVKLPNVNENVSAIVLPLGRAFMGKLLKHGIVNGIKMIRIFRFGKARYEHRLMDEHLTVPTGEIITFKNKFIDDNRMPIRHFIDKHNAYSSREAALLLDAEYNLTNNSKDCTHKYCEEVKHKREQKSKYARMPLFWRAFSYFVYRYIGKLGFLDGKEGFLWDFLQGFWYRILVDAKIYEIKKKCGNDREKIKALLKDDYNITL